MSLAFISEKIENTLTEIERTMRIYQAKIIIGVSSNVRSLCYDIEMNEPLQNN